MNLTAIPYTVKVTTGPEKSMGTDSNVYIKIIGTRKRNTGKQFLELLQKNSFLPGSIETFSLEAIDVGEVRQIEVNRSSNRFLCFNILISNSVNSIFLRFQLTKRSTHFKFETTVVREKSNCSYQVSQTAMKLGPGLHRNVFQLVVILLGPFMMAMLSEHHTKMLRFVIICSYPGGLHVATRPGT